MFCPAADRALDELAGNHVRDMANVTYHAWWPSYFDPFWQADSTENRGRINFYGVAGTPTLLWDGIVTGGPISMWESQLASRMAADSPLTIGLAISYDPGPRTGVLSATITNVSGAAVSGNFRMAITESEIHWSAPNGLQVHNFTMRDMVPTHTGTPVSLGAGASTVVNQPFSVSGAWVESNCQIICFVQKSSPREILQSARAFFPLDQPHIVLDSATGTPVPGGDGDAFLDPGENGNVVATLANLNIAPATATTGTLTTTDPYVSIIDGAASFGTIGAYGTGSNGGDPFVISVSPGAPSGYIPEFTLTVNAGAVAYTRVLTLGIDIGSPTDYTGPAGVYYAYENADIGYTETPDFQWIEIDSALTGRGRTSAHYDDSVDWYRIGFPFRYYGTVYDTLTVSSNGWVALGKQFPSQGDPSPSDIPDADGPYSMIAGMWADLNPVASGSGNRIWRWYDAANHQFVIEYDNILHAGTSTRETFEIILRDPAFYPTATGDGEILVLYKDANDPGSVVAGIENPAQTVGIEYSFFGTANPAAVGIGDSVVVKYTPDAPLRTDVPGVAAAGPVLLMAASPNPFAHATEISFRLPVRDRVSLHVYAVDGRHVATLFDGVADAGITRTRWDSSDATGRPVAAGLYFARLETRAGTRTGKDESQSIKVMVLR